MRQLTKAQIYSVNENLPANQVAQMWDVLDRLERTRKKENSEVADYESKLKKNCKGLFD
jgi:hypothetical protein